MMRRSLKRWLLGERAKSGKILSRNVAGGLKAGRTSDLRTPAGTRKPEALGWFTANVLHADFEPFIETVRLNEMVTGI